MKVSIPRGKYVLAVSGGVDSMVLLDLLSKGPGLELVVAHFDHGIRPDSALDEKFVAAKARQLGLVFEPGHGELGPDASEETARTARYEFLEQVRKKHDADSIITAHHQDDVIETALINLLRGTGRKGMVSIAANRRVIRPLLGYPKSELVDYAKLNGLDWREDATNADENYLRNYIRKYLMPGLSDRQRADIVDNIEKIAKLENIIQPQIAALSRHFYRNSKINRPSFSALPLDLGNELIVYWLRALNVKDIDKATVKRVNMALRTSKAPKTHPVKGGISLRMDKDSAEFINTL